MCETENDWYFYNHFDDYVEYAIYDFMQISILNTMTMWETEEESDVPRIFE